MSPNIRLKEYSIQPRAPQSKEVSLKPKVVKHTTERKKEHQKVYNNKKWQNLRAIHFAQQPLCECCYSQGRIVLGEEMHHTQEFMQEEGVDWGLAFDRDNVTTLCRKCHKAHHSGAITITKIRGEVMVQINNPIKYKEILEREYK